MVGQETNKLHPMHGELLSGDRIKYKDVVKRLSKGWDAGEPATYENNTMVFEYSPETEMVTAFISFGDGADEVCLTRPAFLAELEKHTIGAAKC